MCAVPAVQPTSGVSHTEREKYCLYILYVWGIMAVFKQGTTEVHLLSKCTRHTLTTQNNLIPLSVT
jgi:hypothetical protein